ncbi:hypothetical protein DBY65_022900 [Pseudomonas sp. RIT412]|nr:hypothetical protein DBP26_019885 [Pseudomonas sp. RIT 409]RAU50002.1 hypothetical protein DBY65_022900 [Pseudomonas sp. RIT 412]
MRKTKIASLLMLALVGGCTHSTPQLSEGASRRLNAPMPTSEAQRVWECAGVSGTVKGLVVLLQMQGRPPNYGGEMWALLERARRLRCTQAEMDAPDMGNFSYPPVSPRPK